MRQPRRTEVVDRLLPAVPEINTLGSGNRKWPRGSGVCWPRSDSVSFLHPRSRFQVSVSCHHVFQRRAVCYFVLSIFFRCISWTLWLSVTCPADVPFLLKGGFDLAVNCGHHGVRSSCDGRHFHFEHPIHSELLAFRHPWFEIALPS